MAVVVPQDEGVNDPGEEGHPKSQLITICLIFRSMMSAISVGKLLYFSRAQCHTANASNATPNPPSVTEAASRVQASGAPRASISFTYLSQHAIVSP